MKLCLTQAMVIIQKSEDLFGKPAHLPPLNTFDFIHDERPQHTKSKDFGSIYSCPLGFLS